MSDIPVFTMTHQFFHPLPFGNGRAASQALGNQTKLTHQRSRESKFLSHLSSPPALILITSLLPFLLQFLCKINIVINYLIICCSLLKTCWNGILPLWYFHPAILYFFPLVSFKQSCYSMASSPFFPLLSTAAKMILSCLNMRVSSGGQDYFQEQHWVIPLQEYQVHLWQWTLETKARKMQVLTNESRYQLEQLTLGSDGFPVSWSL